MKRIILILCIVAILSAALVSCGKSMTARAGELSLGMTYEQVTEIMGDDGDVSEDDASIFSWELEDGKTLVVTFDIPLEDGHGVDDGHGHTFDYPDDFIAIDIVIE